MQRRSL